MRGLKFRARALEGGFVYFSLFEAGNHYKDDDVFYANGIACYCDSVEQYTDLKDKNDVEIYEGDIVKEGSITRAIMWHKDRSRYISTRHISIGRLDHVKYPPYMDFDDYEAMECEVIGNIHENGELLNDKTK